MRARVRARIPAPARPPLEGGACQNSFKTPRVRPRLARATRLRADPSPLPSPATRNSVELAPYVVTRKSDGTSTTADIPESDPVNGCHLRYRWYRSGSHRKASVCSVHPGEPAVLQNVHSKSFHCGEECFAQSWREWMRNRMANGGRDEHQREPLWKPPHLKDQPPGGGGGGGGSPHGTPHGSSGSLADAATHHGGYRGPKPHGGPGKDEPETWSEVGHSKCYSATMEDVGHLLKFEVTPVDAGGREQGASVVFTTARVIPAPNPPRRNLVPVAHHDGEQGGRFTVLTYNVLADLYATSEMYGYTPSWALSWNYRRQNILKEIVQHNADILCLQEVQSDHFEDFFAGELAKHGYVAVYKKKTAQVFSQGTYVIDGCAIFFKKDRFTLIKKYEVEFNKAALSLVESLGGSAQKKEALNRLMKDNVALIVVLEALEQSPNAPQGKRQLLCVANTHIHANTELNDVKLWQVHTLLKGLEKIAASAEIPMVVCGDFNSVPGSAAHNLLSDGRVDGAHPELATDPFGILRPPSKLQHPLPLVSAYTALTKQPCLESDAAERQRTRMDAQGTGEPIFTNCTDGFFGTLDYIFYTDDTLAPLSLLELPTEGECRSKYGGLPNTQCSSDHVSLMAEFQWGARRW